MAPAGVLLQNFGTPCSESVPQSSPRKGFRLLAKGAEELLCDILGGAAFLSGVISSIKI